MNLFEESTRKKLRYVGPSGALTTEQLWDLPLKSSSPNTPSLDSIAIDLHNSLKSEGVTFVQDALPGIEQRKAELKLEVVKRVIAVKQEQARKRLDAKARSAQRAKIVSALESKEDDAIANKSKQSLLKELRELDAEDAEG